MSGPIEQFDIKPLIKMQTIKGLDLSFTNSSLFMLFTVVIAVIFFAVALRSRNLVPTKIQSVCELIYEMIVKMIIDMVGKEGLIYLPLVFSLFLYVTLGNLLALIPYGFTFTAHFAAIGALSCFALGNTIYAGIKERGLSWFRTFFPKGTPIGIAPLLIPIEVISFLSKPFSLTVRLVLNMIVGHIMLKVVAGFIYDLSYWGGWLPLLFISLLTVFELMIAVLQAYIYTILTCVYLGDAMHSH